MTAVGKESQESTRHKPLSVIETVLLQPCLFELTQFHCHLPSDFSEIPTDTSVRVATHGGI